MIPKKADNLTERSGKEIAKDSLGKTIISVRVNEHMPKAVPLKSNIRGCTLQGRWPSLKQYRQGTKQTNKQQNKASKLCM